MKTSKYQTSEERKIAKRVSRHPAYQAMRERALAAERNAAYWRADNRRLVRDLYLAERDLESATKRDLAQKATIEQLKEQS